MKSYRVPSLAEAETVPKGHRAAECERPAHTASAMEFAPRASLRAAAAKQPARWSAGGRASEPSLATAAGPEQVILFLAANPDGTERLALDREAHAIQVELERSGHRDRFVFVTRWAVEPLDLLRELRRLRPTVLHFSGHGGHGATGAQWSDATRRDVAGDGEPHGEPTKGMYFQSSDGRPCVVSSAALRDAIDAAGSSVQVVVLSACYSEPQADALLASVDCVVGMSGAIRDDAARAFAIGFYGGLGEQESVAAAFQQGRAAIRLHGLDDAVQPQLKVRDGVDPDRVVLAADPR
jgi:hypothetical protein